MNFTTSNREHNNCELTDAELFAVCGGSAKAGSWHSTNKTTSTTTGGLGSVSASISGGTSV
jgi:hypothetical protein